MIYKNPRLKHVKKIIELIYDVPISMEEAMVGIRKQCNLLLATKPKKKNKRDIANASRKFIQSISALGELGDIPKMSDLQLNLIRNNFEHFYFYYGKTKPSPQPNDDGYYGASGAGTPHTSSPQLEKCELHRTLDCPYCFAPQPEIEPFNLKDGWASSISKRSLADKLNLVIDQLNKLTKTK